LGSVRGVAQKQAGGNTSSINQVQYDAYGKITSQTNVGNQPRFGFAGRDIESVGGMTYNRNRYYSTSSGRFISQDPIGFGGGDANLYRYVKNSPTNATDPSGLLEDPLVAPLNGIPAVENADQSGSLFNPFSWWDWRRGEVARESLAQSKLNRLKSEVNAYEQAKLLSRYQQSQFQRGAEYAAEGAEAVIAWNTSGSDFAIVTSFAGKVAARTSDELIELVSKATWGRKVEGLTKREVTSASRAYAEAVNGNKKWAWPDLGNFSDSQKELIKAFAFSQNLIKDAEKVIVTKYGGRTYLNFKNIAYKFKVNRETMTEVSLPQSQFGKTREQHFAYLDSIYFNGKRPEGWTWHHMRARGKMQLVPQGLHAVMPHTGGMAKGHWGYCPVK
jgi:RHS repeat-associated protein